MATMSYLNKVPAQVPQGLVIVHNQVRPPMRLGSRGFRAWPDDRLEICGCGWAPASPQHYRVKSIPERGTTTG
jgi:hypothetical protein